MVAYTGDKKVEQDLDDYLDYIFLRDLDVNEGFVVVEVTEVEEEVVVGNESEEVLVEDEKEFDEIEFEDDDENINNYVSSIGSALNS